MDTKVQYLRSFPPQLTRLRGRFCEGLNPYLPNRNHPKSASTALLWLADGVKYRGRKSVKP